ncbi:GATA zinc finger domain-containing protein 14-like [Schistocerca gregaria]|uniref:GATA zinc finger domain-containing protein 14-like n=1 Tax=Schistocerca gregaria TaxID=7010 RepID=UPI00211E6EA6|nr:GATA zinc finger domain-containing protein 14-like [Schistocerca gregaria]
MSQSYIGSRFSLTDTNEMRYVGTLTEINSIDSTLTLSNVISYGTEGRNTAEPVFPSNEVIPALKFHRNSIKGLVVFDPSFQQPSATPEVPSHPDTNGIMNNGSYIPQSWGRNDYNAPFQNMTPQQIMHYYQELCAYQQYITNQLHQLQRASLYSTGNMLPMQGVQNFDTMMNMSYQHRATSELQNGDSGNTNISSSFMSLSSSAAEPSSTTQDNSFSNSSRGFSGDPEYFNHSLLSPVTAATPSSTLHADNLSSEKTSDAPQAPQQDASFRRVGSTPSGSNSTTPAKNNTQSSAYTSHRTEYSNKKHNTSNIWTTPSSNASSKKGTSYHGQNHAAAGNSNNGYSKADHGGEAMAKTNHSHQNVKSSQGGQHGGNYQNRFNNNNNNQDGGRSYTPSDQNSNRHQKPPRDRHGYSSNFNAGNGRHHTGQFKPSNNTKRINVDEFNFDENNKKFDKLSVMEELFKENLTLNPKPSEPEDKFFDSFSITSSFNQKDKNSVYNEKQTNRQTFGVASLYPAHHGGNQNGNYNRGDGAESGNNTHRGNKYRGSSNNHAYSGNSSETENSNRHHASNHHINGHTHGNRTTQDDKGRLFRAKIMPINA